MASCVAHPLQPGAQPGCCSAGGRLPRDSPPLESFPLPEGDAEGLALRDGDREARGEAELRGVPDGSAGVPLCVGDAAALPSADALAWGVGLGPADPEPADSVGAPLTLGEREPERDSAADGDTEGEGRAVREACAVSDAAGDGERSADADCREAVGAAVSPPEGVASGVCVPSPLATGESDASAEGEASPERRLVGVPKGESVPSAVGEGPSVAVSEGGAVDEAAVVVGGVSQAALGPIRWRRMNSSRASSRATSPAEAASTT
jgi:hypothetical protein